MVSHLSVAEPKQSNYQVKYSFHELDDSSQNHHNSCLKPPAESPPGCSPPSAGEAWGTPRRPVLCSTFRFRDSKEGQLNEQSRSTHQAPQRVTEILDDRPGSPGKQAAGSQFLRWRTFEPSTRAHVIVSSTACMHCCLLFIP